MVDLFLLILFVAAVSSEAVAFDTLRSYFDVLNFKPFNCVFCLGFWLGCLGTLFIMYSGDVNDAESIRHWTKIYIAANIPFMAASASQKLENFIYK
jgi:hypothetical protein